MGNLKSVADFYKNKYNSVPLLIRSPGRVNLIGEHTDYNLGSVLPGAINKYIYFAIGARDDNQINIDASDYSDTYSASLDKLEPAWKLWPNYVLGVINELKKAGKVITGLNIVFGGDIPLSAGMSSSAAITSATAFSLNKLFHLGYSKLELAKIAVAAEHNYLGVHCGLMDPFVNLHGKEGNLIKLNCNTEQYAFVPFKADDIQIILFDSGVKHNIIKLTAAFNERRNQCQHGLALVKEHFPEVKSLSDVDEQMLLKYVKPVDEIAYKRCLYVVQENARLEAICDDLEQHNFEAAGRRMFENHEGLKNLYEVSCDECDFLVETTKNIDGVLGSRMMGAGFGGCTINLVKSNVADEVIDRVKKAYLEKFQTSLKVYNASIGNGTEEVALPE